MGEKEDEMMMRVGGQDITTNNLGNLFTFKFNNANSFFILNILQDYLLITIIII